jgi:TP901 family phage tail tape measure protein
MAKSGTAASAVAANQAQNLMNSINATGKFQASMRTVTSSTESFTNALEKNKLTSREYFRYTGAATKTFGKLFKSEFDTINKVARERVKDVQTQYIKMGRGANGALQAIAVRPLTLDMKNLGTQTAIAAQRQQLLNQLLKQGSTNLLNFGKNTQWAGRQLMVGFTVPLAMLGSAAAKTFMQLEEQAIRFKRVYGELFTTQEETDAMVKDIQLLANEYTKYGVAVEKTMKMAADAAAQGKMGADLVAQVSEATRLAVLGGVEQEEALLTTISVTNAFGVATEDLAKKIDFLNAVENQTVVSIEDLTIAIPKAGPVVQQLGGDVEDLAFFLTAMKEGGINASEGANALKSGLASLINPSEKASKMLMGLGVNIKGIVEGNQGDVKSTVIDFAKALDTLDPLNRARAIEQLFGKFQFSRLSTLFQNVIGQGTQAERVLTLSKATAEELAILSERELGKIENTTTYKFKKSIEDLKVTLAPVGEAFLKALTPIVEFVSKVLDKFNNLGEGGKKFVTILTVALGAIGPIALMTFGLLANGVANIIKLFATMKGAYNRAGSSTQVLGQQTSYLTQEQLEASAVAASLNQVHTTLRQTFTSEASAVNALALAYKNAIAAQIGFTGPVRGGGMKGPPQSKKYSTGVTSVPGSGNQDTVPAMLTPGEAVIPAGAAQDPANKPIIARMVAGQKVQGFNTGTTKVTYNGKEYNAKTARSAQSVREFLNQLVENPDKTLTDPHTGKTFTREQLSHAIDYRSQPGKDLNASQIRRSIKRENRSNRSAVIKRLTEVYDEKNAKIILEEKETLQKALKERGLPPLTEDQAKDAFKTKKAHLTKDVDEDGNKRWRVVNVAPDAGYINQYMNTVEQSLGKDLLKMSDADLTKLGIDRDHLKGFIDGNHPRDAKQLDTFRNIAKYDIALDEKRKVKKANIYQAHLVDAGLEWRAKEGIGGYKEGGLKSFADLNPNDKKVILERVAEADPKNRFSPEHQRRLKQVADDAAKTKSGKLAPTNFGRLVAPTTGFSFDVPGVGGLYDGPNGKVFVKPMMSELDALAEKKATDFARQVHGLDTPEQKISTIIDPSDPEGKRKIIVLESPYDERFDEKKMSKTFNREQYFRQLVASAVRGDKDLKMGNLGGNALTDVGTAGVFDKATSTGKDGIRQFAKNMPSLYDMAERNLQGVTGPQAKNSPNWFANETQKKINQKGYTADKYHADMKAEIERIQTNAKAFVMAMPPDDPLRGEYEKILNRINEGAAVKDWRPLFHKHRSIAIKPNEVKLEEDGKAKKPKSERKRSNVKTANSGDSRLTSQSNESQIRKTTTVRGKADAATIINPNLAQRLEENKIEQLAKKKAMAEADARERYGTSKPTAYERSVRRKNQKNAIQGMPLVGQNREVAPPVSAVNPALEQRMLERRAADAANKQAAAEADSRNRYGTTTPTAEQRSIRRYNDKSQSQGRPLVALTKELSAPVSVFRKALDRASETIKKQSVAGKALEKFRAKQDKKEADKKAGTAKPGMGAGGAAMGIAGIAMVGSMLPGAVGEMSQKLMMPLMGLAMILPMVQSKFAALALGIGLVVAAFAYQRMQFDKAQNAALELGNAMGVGKDSMMELSKFAGKVSAGEVMDKRRKEKFNILPIQTGKNTFGQSFVSSKLGKETLANIGKAGGTAKTVDAQSAQLQNAVMSGAMTMDQAKSVAANLGKELGDYSYGIKIIGKLTELLGPNGENLEKDPYNVRVKAMQQTRTRVETANKNMAKSGGILQDGFRGVGGVAAGAGAGAAAGAALGTVVPVIGNVVGAVAGTVVGAIAGGIMAYKDRAVRIGEATGASVAMDKMALEQNQEMLDSFELQMEQKIELLRTQGKMNEAVELENDYYKERDKLLAEAKITKDTILANYDSSSLDVKDAYETGVGKSITKKYKDTIYEDMVPLATGEISRSKLTDKQKMSLRLDMESGAIDPNQMISLFETFKDKASQEAIINISSTFGGKYAAETIQLVRGFGEDQALKEEYVLQLSKIKTSQEAEDFQDFFRRLTTYDNVIPAKISVDYFLKNPTIAKELEERIDQIENSKGEKSITFYADIIGGKALAALNSDAEYFNKLDKNQEIIYTTALAYQLQLEGDPDQQAAFKAWQAANKGKGPTEYINFAASNAKAVTVSSGDTTKPTVNPNDNKEGTKVDSSPLDELLKRLRDVRKNQIKVTEGWGASQKALNKLFGGSKTIEIFSGIENDMRKLGAGEDLIELIVGMDPKEYEKRKKSLFEFDAKGNIKKIKDNAKSIGDAIASVSLGEFVSEQERMSKQMGNQVTALTRLKAAGIEGSVALEAVADATFAAAIANKKLSDKQIKQIAKSWKEATTNKKNYAAVQTIEAEKTSLQERVDLLTRMTSLLGTFNQEEVNAIISNDALASSLANLKNISPNDPSFKSFLDLLEKTLNKNKTELKIKRLSIDGLQQIFDDGFNAAMDQADVKEKTFRLKFESDTRGLQKSIDLAQDEISGWQYSIDDQEAMLRAIEKQEQKINDKYEERIDALDQVEKANNAISAQQKGQLTLAEALTSGDIAAAARAAQEMRAQEAANAVTKEKEALEKSREYELSRVRQDGKSREDIEKEIERLQDLVYAKEEIIEKAQEEIRQKEITLREAIRPIDVERARWEQMQNDIDVARTNNDKFLKLMADAEAIVKELTAKYWALKPDTDPIVGAGTLVPGPGPGPGPGPDPVGPCGPGYFMNQEGKCIQIKKDEVVVEGTGPCGPGYFMNQEGKCIQIKKDNTDTGTDPKKKVVTDPAPVGFTETPTTPYKPTWMNIDDPTARGHVKDMETNIAANIVRNSELFNREVNALKIKENAGDGAAMHYKSLNQLTDQMNLAKKYNTGPDYAKQQAENLAANKAAAAKKAADEETLKKFGGNAAAANAFGNWPVKRAMGGIIPKRFALGGFAKGTDTVPAMLTPGEFIMSKYAVDSYGVDNMRKINNGDSVGGTVYNNTYTLTVNAKTDANPNDIAQAVMSTIKRVDDRRIRGVALNGR